MALPFSFKLERRPVAVCSFSHTRPPDASCHASSSVIPSPRGTFFFYAFFEGVSLAFRSSWFNTRAFYSRFPPTPGNLMTHPSNCDPISFGRKIPCFFFFFFLVFFDGGQTVLPPTFARCLFSQICSGPFCPQVSVCFLSIGCPWLFFFLPLSWIRDVAFNFFFYGCTSWPRSFVFCWQTHSPKFLFIYPPSPQPPACSPPSFIYGHTTPSSSGF